MVAQSRYGLMDNLLYNITSRDTIYKVIRNTIAYLLPEDLRELYESSAQIQIIGTDSFFIHYSVAPLLVERHYDHILEKARGFFLKYMLSSNFESVRKKTVLNENLSLIYAVELTRAILESIKGNEGSKGKRGPSIASEQEGRGEGGEENERSSTENKTNVINVSDENEGEKEEKMGGLERILEQASDHAKRMVEGASSVMDVLGGGGAGSEPGSLKKIINIAHSVLEVRDSDRIVRLALETLEGIPKPYYMRKKEAVMGDEIRGYARTTKLERVLPRELAFPDDIFLYKLVGEGVLRREKAFSKQGALYVLVDKSGSMSGYKTIWSRSVALSLRRVARERGAKFYLRLFDTGVYPEDKPLEDDLEIMEILLTAPSNGGTRITKAVKAAVKDLEKGSEEREADTIILITDGEDNVDIDKNYLESHSVKLITVMVGGDNKALKEASTAYFTAALTVDGAIDLIKSTESIVLKRAEGKPLYRHT